MAANVKALVVRLGNMGLSHAKAYQPDAVSINTWPNTHAHYALQSVEVGCHVFMEKPIATNIEDAEKIVAMARGKHRNRTGDPPLGCNHA